ncbi:MAG: hypothetical protein ACRDHZ_09350 [Ktedonobacteraceae bacterium]
MSQEHDQPGKHGNSEDESETPSRPITRSRPRGVPGAGRIYEEYDEPPAQRSRTTRQAHDEALARVRKRPRQPLYSGEQPEEEPLSPEPKPRRTTPHREPIDDYSAQSERLRRERTSAREYENFDEYEEKYAEYDRVRDRRTQRSYGPQRRRRRQRGGVGSRILTGCLGALLTLVVIAVVGAYYLFHNTPLGQNFGKSAYTQQVSQTIALGNASELIVKNQIGNVSISVGGSASSASLTSVRKVQAGSQSDADSQFSKITLSTQQISQGTNPACTASSCVLITAALPPNASSGDFFGSVSSSSIDLTLIVPTSFNSSDPTKPYTLSANTISGDLAVSGFNGILNLTGNSGNITVTHALIFAGTCLQAMQGDISVGQGSIFDLDQPSDQIPCTTTTSSGVHAWFNITSGRGNVDVMLTAPSTNLLLDANTNNGKISDDFGLTIPSTNDGSASFHGPLLPNGTPTASLYVLTNAGNIEIHQQ